VFWCSTSRGSSPNTNAVIVMVEARCFGAKGCIRRRSRNGAASERKVLGKLWTTRSRPAAEASGQLCISKDDAQNGPGHVDGHRSTWIGGQSVYVAVGTARRSDAVRNFGHAAHDTTLAWPQAAEPVRRHGTPAALVQYPPHGCSAKSIGGAVRRHVHDGVNTAQAFGADLSAQLDFEREDRAPVAEWNAIIRHALKGDDAPYPQSIGSAQRTRDD
jgi:hypothetical protein